MDGQLEVSQTYGKYLAVATDQFRIGYAYNTDSASSHFNGDIKDVRIYAGNAFSADQVASLYSNTLPTTPDLWFKNEDGLTYSQSGIYSATSLYKANGGGVAVDGTLDLDGTLTIAANGTLSAPRGTLLLDDNFTVATAGGFEANSGTVETDGSGEVEIGTQGVTTTFNNLKGSNSSFTTIECNPTILGNFNGR